MADAALLKPEAVPHYERADASLLARTAAIIPFRAKVSGEAEQEWQDFRSYLEQVLLGLRSWRTPWWLHWGEIAANILPRRYHWLVTPNQMTRGLPINQNVVDSTPAQALSVCAAGLMDGLSSPTKNWFKLQPAIKGFEPDTAGQRWLKEFQARIYTVLAGSNYYDCKHQYYEDEAAFATGVMLIYEHPKKIISCQNPCAGEYYLAVGGDNEVNTFYREFTMTTRQIVEGFGSEVLAGTDMGQLWNTKGANLETESIVAHAIEPNFAANQPGQPGNLGVVPGGFAYREIYWLRGKNSPRPLSVRGFHERPYMAGLWNRRSNDPYGRGSPGMDGLPDVLQLHQMTRRFAEAIDKMVRPPMLADAALKNEPSSILPGRVTYVPNLGKDTGMRPTYIVDPHVGEMKELIKEIQQRIERWFYVDVFMAITQMQGVQPRNELEINQRLGEKLLRLGPVIERNLREDALGLSRVVAIMNRRGLVPPKPASLRNVPVEIAFVSKLALIQQAAVTGSMERVLAIAGRMEAALPGTLDNIPKDKFIRIYGEKLDYPPDAWADDNEMKQVRDARAKAQQQAQQAQQIKEMGPAIAGSAKDLSATDLGGGLNALQMLTGGSMPMTGAQQ